MALSIIAAIGSFYSFTHKPIPSTPVVHSGITERDKAIEQAVATGQKTYSYTSSFMPGIGPGSNPSTTK